MIALSFADQFELLYLHTRVLPFLEPHIFPQEYIKDTLLLCARFKRIDNVIVSRVRQLKKFCYNRKHIGVRTRTRNGRCGSLCDVASPNLLWYHCFLEIFPFSCGCSSSVQARVRQQSCYKSAPWNCQQLHVNPHSRFELVLPTTRLSLAS